MEGGKWRDREKVDFGGEEDVGERVKRAEIYSALFFFWQATMMLDGQENEQNN